jgi:ABC-2 type transport system permease protein
MFFLFLASSMTLSALEGDPLFEELIPKKILELIHYGFFILLLFSNTIVALGRIYTAESMDILLRAPTSNLRLFFAKFFEIYFETTLMMFIFILPVAYAYCNTLGISYDFITSLMSGLVLLAIIPTGLSFALAAIVSRLASKLWKRGGLLLSSVILLAVWAFWTLSKLLQEVRLEKGGTNAIVQFIGLFDNPNPYWLPSRWAVDSLSGYFGSSAELISTKFGALLLTSLGSLALGFLFFDFSLLHLRSLIGTHEGKSSTNLHKADISRRLLEFIYDHSPFDGQFRAIIVKDLTNLFRDKTQALQMIMYLLIACTTLIFIEFMSSAFDLSLDAQEVWWSTLLSLNFLCTGSIVTALMTRLVYPSISLEGRAFWIIRTAPISLQGMVEAKFWCWMPFVSTIAICLLVAGTAAVHQTPLLLLYSLYLALCVSLGCTGLAIGIGSTFATFQWESASQISSGFGTLVLLLSSLILVALTALPATALFFIITTESMRYQIGLEKTPVVAACCIMMIFLINSVVAICSCKRGVCSLKARSLL